MHYHWMRPLLLPLWHHALRLPRLSLPEVASCHRRLNVSSDFKIFARPNSVRVTAPPEQEPLFAEFRDMTLVSAPTIFVVNGAPAPELPACNRRGHLVEMPTRSWPQASGAKFSGEHPPELKTMREFLPQAGVLG
jgi:hypothetical protein